MKLSGFHIHILVFERQWKFKIIMGKISSFSYSSKYISEFENLSCNLHSFLFHYGNFIVVCYEENNFEDA